MKYTITIILIFFSLIQVSCQSETNLKLITKNRGVSPKSIEKYYVVRNNKKIRTGKYEKYKGVVLVETGYYKNNLRDSIWTDYSLDGNIIAQGNFKNDYKVGLWYYLSFQGDTIQIYNHTDKIMVYYNIEKERELFPHKILLNGLDTEIDTSKLTIADKIPVFIGGTTMIHNLIITNLTYPVIDAENGKKGVSKVAFTIDKEGKINNVYTKNTISEGIDKEAIRLVNLLGDNWEPGEQNGKKVNVEFVLPLTFSFDYDYSIKQLMNR